LEEKYHGDGKITYASGKSIEGVFSNGEFVKQYGE
jgi:hypothetical protein